MLNSNEHINVEIVLDPAFHIPDTYPVSNKSYFRDDLWDFSDDSNQRLNSVNKSKLKFNWNEWQEKTNAVIALDFKTLAFFYLKCPTLVSNRNSTRSGYKPNTVHTIFKNALSVFSKIFEESTIDIDGNKISLIKDLSDITIEQLQSVPLIKALHSVYKKLLKDFTLPSIRRLLVSNIQWEMADVNQLKIPFKQELGIKHLSTQPLKDEFFVDLVKQATLDILNFKSLIGDPIHSQVPRSYVNELNDIFQIKDFKNAFNHYIEIRKVAKKKAILSGRGKGYTGNLRKQFNMNYSITVQDYFTKLRRVHRAAIYLLLQFTGVRYSEAITFKEKCVQNRVQDIYVIKGTVIKNRATNLPIDIDEWVAAPIVRDVVDVLNRFQEFTFNSYLVSSLNSVHLKEEDNPLSLGGIKSMLNSYVEELANEDPRFVTYFSDKNNTLMVHRLRHTLALHLVRAKLGIPYISYHLKHVHTAVVAYRNVSNVTLGYGGIATDIFNSVSALKQARGELYEEIYNPNSPVGGGVNLEEFKKRRKEYFQGMMVSDEEIEDIIEELKEQSIPFLDVGLGYCGGRKNIILKDGTNKPPPCIGQLQCNPIDCGNAIVSKSKLPIWQKIYEENNLRLQDPAFNYAKLELQKVVNQAFEVIQHFQSEGEKDE